MELLQQDAKKQHGLKQSGRSVTAIWAIVFCLWLITMSAAAQQTGLAGIVKDLKTHRQQALQEKVFLHLDRPQYLSGETMWFKLYNVDGTLHRPLHMSKLAYVEVLDAQNQPVLQGKVPLKDGMGKGSFQVPFTLNSGHYTVRAYTNWMKNFEPEFYFEQPVTILNIYKKLDLKPAEEAAALSVQFFPEGGNLVQGLPCKVAFKVIDASTGKGIAATGEVRNRIGNVVATFEPAAFGIGHFTFTPGADEVYTAVVRADSQRVLAQQLPPVYEQGYTLQLQEAGTSALKLIVRSTLGQKEQVYLLGHARQMVAVGAAGFISEGETVFTVSTDSLADGITHFTLFNSKRQPVCERLYFKQPTQKLDIEATVAKNAFSQREEVQVNLLTQSEPGSVVPADLSLAVYRLDESQTVPTTDISSYLLLTSELQGQVENPMYYLTNKDSKAREAVDNLMLTHGWSRFKWEDIQNRTARTISYTPEYDGHLIRGRLSHSVSGAPASGIAAYLGSPSRHVRLYHAVSDSSGVFQFEVKDFLGPREIVLQTDFREDSTYHFEVFNPFSEKYTAYTRPIFDVSESLEHSIALRHKEVEAQQLYFRAYRQLFKPSGIDSIAFYGHPDQQYFLDDYTRFKVMEEVMREYVSGVMVRKRRGRFHFLLVNKPYKTYFKEDPMVLLDGVPVFDIDKIMAFDPLLVKRLDVITATFLHGPVLYDGIVSYATYKGDLGGFPLDPRALMMEYEGLQQEREFYAPAYATAEEKQSRLPDFRNLLYWSPQILTKADGKGRASFFTSDSAGIYLLVVQGITNNGLFGSQTLTFEVKQPL
ncbi:hypothetical protein ACMA1I_12480 [Pontibacter sp. 13R65]|uniref:hypothetical protein n=1 Tax=Pontibacter sp. 13R65 TaxID=3127458 RepID=UPI00301BC7C1